MYFHNFFTLHFHIVHPIPFNLIYTLLSFHVHLTTDHKQQQFLEYQFFFLLRRLLQSKIFNPINHTSLHFLHPIPGRGRRSGSVVSKSFCRLHLLAPPAVPACPGSQDWAISLWVCLLVAFRGSPINACFIIIKFWYFGSCLNINLFFLVLPKVQVHQVGLFS